MSGRVTFEAPCSSFFLSACDDPMMLEATIYSATASPAECAEVSVDAGGRWCRALTNDQVDQQRFLTQEPGLAREVVAGDIFGLHEGSWLGDAATAVLIVRTCLTGTLMGS